MEFWGVEVKGGVPCEVSPFPGLLVNIKQAALGETTKKEEGAEKSIPLRLKTDNKDSVIGYLKPGERPHLALDLIFERKFVLSHDWKDGSIYFAGKTFEDPDSGSEYSSDEYPDSGSESV